MLAGGNLSVLGKKLIWSHGPGLWAVGRGMLSDVVFCRCLGGSVQTRQALWLFKADKVQGEGSSTICNNHGYNTCR